VQAERPEWLAADLAVLAEPTNGAVEAGCQGTVSVSVTVHGRRAHAARSWVGDNAIHRTAALLQRIAEFPVRTVEIDGCVYREGLNATGITGGVASNVVPDECVVRVNHRFAPDRSPDEAIAAVTEALAGEQISIEVLDVAAGALPGLRAPAAAGFVAAAGGTAVGKLGWTDVARFAALGIPAVNYGPGDPLLAHTAGEWVSLRQVREMTEVLRHFLSG
jgi:succinyl-diaminopimelate desuccinylase